MRMYFQDPKGQRLAIDTNRKKWAASYAPLAADIDDSHAFINVQGAEDLTTIEKELDFNCWGYNKDLPQKRTPFASVFTNYLQKLAELSAAVEAGQGEDLDELEDFDELAERIEKAKAERYFNARQYAALLLILDDIREAAALYERAEDPEPF